MSNVVEQQKSEVGGGPGQGDPPTLILDTGPRDATAVLLLAHGAGAPMDSAFMTEMSTLLEGRGVRVLRVGFVHRTFKPSRPSHCQQGYRPRVVQS